MASKIFKTRIKTRSATSAQWAAANPVLLAGEVAISTDKNNRYKVGNGSSRWSDLAYGGYIVGTNLTLTGDTISLTKANVTSALGYTPLESAPNIAYASAVPTAASTYAIGDFLLVP